MTITNQELNLRKIEEELEQSLLKLKPIHSFAAKTLIKDRVLQVYESGIRYVSRHFDIPVNLDRNDFRNIDKITSDALRNWRYGHRMDAALVRVTSIALALAIKVKCRQIKIITRVRTAANFDPDFLLNMTPPLVMFPEDQDITALEDATLEDVPFTPVTEEDFASSRLVWHTAQDGRVCDICQPLEGQQYDLDDPSIPTPIEDTHPLCRCRLKIERLSEL